jgi:hypothetical protein
MLTKRNLLAGASFLAIWRAIPSLAWTHGNAGSPPPAGFGGNPNVQITAIDVSGGIELSRSSGQLPAFFQASAMNITATAVGGIVQPYEDLEYTWTLTRAGGSVAAENFTNPSIYPYSTGGPTVNANTDQTGPEAAFVCRVADTYTVTLTIRGANGAGFTTATATTTFTASTFNASGAEVWVDSAAAGGGSGTLQSPINNLGDAFTVLNAAGFTNCAMHLKRGSLFLNGAAGIGNGNTTPVNGFRVDAYGVGADPIREDNVNTYAPIQFSTGSAGSSGGVWLQDIVISNVVAKCGPGNTAQIACGLLGQNDDPLLEVNDFYFDNVTVISTTTAALTSQDVFCLTPNTAFGVPLKVRAGCWNVKVSSPITGSPPNRMGMDIATWEQWLFIVGGSIVGCGQGGAQDHHIYPVIQNNFLVRWMDFGTSVLNGTGDPTRSYCINGDFNNHTTAFSNYSGGPTDSIIGGVLTIGLAANSSPPFQVGMTLFNPAIISQVIGTITSLGTGTGGAGTYNISNGSISIPLFTCIGVVSTAYAQYWCMDSNYFFGTQYSLDLDDGFNCALSCQWKNVVAQKNAIPNLTLGAYFETAGCLTATFRDNLAWGIQGQGFSNFGISGAVAATMAATCRYQLYRNKIYNAQSAVFNIDGGTTLTATRPLVFTDNQIEDIRTGSTCSIVELQSAATQHATSIIDRNNYLCPNATNGGTNASQFNKDSGSVLTFTAWQALGSNFDPNSTATTAAFPTWIDPANGHFT